MKFINWIQIFMVFGFWLEPISSVLRGQCNECLSSNSVACLSDGSFVMCKNGKMTANKLKCPKGTVCTGDKRICLQQSTNVHVICYEDNCNVCDLTKSRFACIDKNVYGFCYDQTQPDPNSIQTCPKGRVCNVENPSVCALESEGYKPSCNPNGNENESTTSTFLTTISISTTSSPSTSELSTIETPKTVTETTDTSSTPEANIDLNEYCAKRGQTGLFKDADDLTCKSYIFCYLLSGQYLGQRYFCNGYFNAQEGLCQAEKPDDC